MSQHWGQSHARKEKEKSQFQMSSWSLSPLKSQPFGWCQDFCCISWCFPVPEVSALYISGDQGKIGKVMGLEGLLLRSMILKSWRNAPEQGVVWSLILLVAGNRKPGSDQYKQNKELSLVTQWARQKWKDHELTSTHKPTKSQLTAEQQLIKKTGHSTSKDIKKQPKTRW